MIKMIGIAISQFANAMVAHSNSSSTNNVSAVFTPGQAPRFEGSNGESIVLPPPPPEEEEADEEEVIKPPKTPSPQKRQFQSD